MKHYGRLYAFLLLMIFPVTSHWSNEAKQQRILNPTAIEIAQCYKTIKHPKHISCEQEINMFDVKLQQLASYTRSLACDIENKLNLFAEDLAEFQKLQQYLADTTEFLNPLRYEMSRIDTRNLRTIYSRDNAIDSVLAYFPRVDTTKRGNIRHLEGLLAIVRLTPVWEYLELKYRIPKRISISFWIWETGYGKSSLFYKYYNFGGIKAHKTLRSYKTYVVMFNDDCGKESYECETGLCWREKKCGFLAFYKLEAGVEVWGRVLALSRYTNHYDMDDNYKTMVAAYHDNGYWSSDLGYVHRVGTIEDLGLQSI